MIDRALRTAAVSAVVLATLVSLTACGIRIPPVDPQPNSDKGSSVTGSDLSTLDSDGIARILETKEARFDMRSGTIDKVGLGLPSDEYAPDVQSRDGLIDLEILAPQGSVTASTDRIRFFTTAEAPDVKRITYFLTADTTDAFVELLRDGVEKYGIDSASVESWIDSIGSDADGVSDFSFDPGTSLGLNVNYDLRYDASAAVQVVIVQVYPL